VNGMKKRFISVDDGLDFQKAEFPQFERRPVNYYRDIFVDEDHTVAPQISEELIQTRVEEALAAEREQMHKSASEERQSQFKLGLTKGREEATEELRRAIELLTQYAQILQAEKREIAAEAEKSSIDIAFSVAKKIIGEELQTRPELVGEVVGRALRQVLDCDQIRLRVNPGDLDYLKSLQGDLQNLVSGDVRLDMRADESIEKGGCMIETERGVLDAQISSQLQTLRSALSGSSEKTK